MRRGKITNRLLDYYLGVPALNLVASLHRRRRLPDQNSIRRIGLMFSHALGDTLIASGPTQDIRAQFPVQEIILFAAPSNLEAAKMLPGVDRIVTISLTQPVNAMRKMRVERLDLLLDFTAWQRLTAFLTLNSGARFAAGFQTNGQHRHRGYDLTVEHRADAHELDNLRSLAAAVGVTTGAAPHLNVPAGPTPDALRRGDEIFVVHAWPSGTKSWIREWPESHWIELAKRLRRAGRHFVLTGAPDDRDRTSALCERFRSVGANAEVLIGEGGIAEIARLLREARMLISVNTGIMHLGSIIGTPTISINGPNAQRRWGPIGANSIGIDTPDGTGGFLDLGFEFSGRPSDSMSKISADRVVSAAEQLMAAQPLMEDVH